MLPWLCLLDNNQNLRCLSLQQLRRRPHGPLRLSSRCSSENHAARCARTGTQERTDLPFCGDYPQESLEKIAHNRANALLPTASFTTSELYTQSNGVGGVKFIANNSPHEYVSQGNVHQVLDVASIADYRRSAALAAAAKARAEIAARGLVVTVMRAYFGVASADQKLMIARRISDEGDKFFKLTQDLEKGGEVAHSDVIKAELQMRDRQRQLQEAQLAQLNARLDLAVLLFPDFNDNFELADDLHANIPLPARTEFEAQAAQQNPEIRAALANFQAAGHDVTSARSGYLPSIDFDYWYGIDASRYATYTPNPPPPDARISNLGSSAMASLTLPVWNWARRESCSAG